jgi:hypothetical protein
MKALACLDLFDFDDTTFAPADGVDGVHSEGAITDQPRHD